VSYTTDSFDKHVIQSLKTGGVGFMPADTVYGLSCSAFDESAVDRIYRIKYRFEGKPFIILISDIDQLKLLKIDPKEVEPIKQYWPGGLTYICSAPKTPQWLQRGTKTLAVRLPDHEELRELIRQVGPIVSTSANLYARKPAASLLEAVNYFGDKLEFYVNVGKLEGLPSTIVRLKAGKLEVLRKGAVKINT
jgi:tRNA threonylcarbamoyl adenosine modification protein (Sua5/YciO/YrdC/YwlC family)